MSIETAIQNHHGIMNQLIFNMFKGLNINAGNAVGRYVKGKIPEDMQVWLRNWIRSNPTEAAIVQVMIGGAAATVADIQGVLKRVFKMSDVNAALGDDILDDLLAVVASALKEALLHDQSGAFMAAKQTPPAYGNMRIIKELRDSGKFRWTIHGDEPCVAYDTALVESTTSKTVFDEVEAEGNDKNKKGNKKVRKPREETRPATVITTTAQAASSQMGETGYKVCDRCNAWKLIIKALIDKTPHDESKSLRAAFLHMLVERGAAKEAVAFLNEPGALEKLERLVEYRGQILPEDAEFMIKVPPEPELPESSNSEAVEKRFSEFTEGWREGIERKKDGEKKDEQLKDCREALQNMERHRATIVEHDVFKLFLASKGEWTETKFKDFFLDKALYNHDTRVGLITAAANKFEALQKDRDEKILKPWKEACKDVHDRRERIFQEAADGLTKRAEVAKKKIEDDKAAEKKKHDDDEAAKNKIHAEAREKARARGRASGLTDAEMDGDFSDSPTLFSEVVHTLSFGMFRKAKPKSKQTSETTVPAKTQATTQGGSHE